MTTILHLDASARTTRSLSRRLSQLFVDAWAARRPADRIIRRDLAADPPPHVSEAWIAASFTPRPTSAMQPCASRSPGRTRPLTRSRRRT